MFISFIGILLLSFKITKSLLNNFIKDKYFVFY